MKLRLNEISFWQWHFQAFPAPVSLMDRQPVTLRPRNSDTADFELMPFRFHRSTDRVICTNMVGEHVSLTDLEFDAFASRTLADDKLLRTLRGKHFIKEIGESLPGELVAMKLRTQRRRLVNMTGLHIFVVTLRCEHTCAYCQVSRQNSKKTEFDMSVETAFQALDMTFQSPSPSIKIEFQGGEPFLNFPLVKEIVIEAERRNMSAQRNLSFVIATNLALLDDDVIEFAREHEIYFSTSIDGPAELHTTNRPRPGRDSWQRAVDGIRRIQSELGNDRVAALMTTTEASLDQVKPIIDSYVDLDLGGIFLRPISPYGFAVRRSRNVTYEVNRWLEFYNAGLDYIIKLNRDGIALTEYYAAMVLKKILTNDDPAYVDLTSPAGIGIGALVYNYNGAIYASDEGRMLAEMNDDTFKLGELGATSYAEVMMSDRLLDPIEESFAYSAPMCNDCAFETYCGSDPVYHHTTSGDFLGKKPLSAFCKRNMSIFELLLTRYDSDAFTRRLFDRWANQ